MTLPEFPHEKKAAYPEASQATTVLVLGIVGIIFSIVGPIAWIMANGELRAINEGRRDPANASTANTGKVLGIIGTVLLVVGVLAVALLTVVFVGGVRQGVFGTLG